MWIPCEWFAQISQRRAASLPEGSESRLLDYRESRSQDRRLQMRVRDAVFILSPRPTKPNLIVLILSDYQWQLHGAQVQG
jgi:hypothetical protein